MQCRSWSFPHFFMQPQQQQQQAAGAASGASGGAGKIKYRVDVEKNVVVANCERRGWIQTTGNDWNLYWANVSSVKQLFNPEAGQRLTDHQLINHFPNHYELTRKDLMVKNVKRYIKELSKSSGQQVDDFVPVSYMLPADYSLFVEEFRRNANAVWIMKPTNRAQGKGIFIINRLSQIKKWSSGTRWASLPAKDTYLISRYIENPLLIGGKKFDLRIYVLVTSYKPLRLYKYSHGFARFCTTKYTSNVEELDNPFIHLTNVAIQKHGEDYNSQHGGKWHIQNLRLFLEASWGYDMTQKLFEEIDALIVHSVKAVQNVMINPKQCFEVLGYDVIIDAGLRPWLVEVNASPSLGATTESDRVMKMSLLRDTLAIVVPENGVPPNQAAGAYAVLYDEEQELREQRAKVEAALPTRRRPSTRSENRTWR